MDALLEVRNLTIQYGGKGAESLGVTRDLSFSLWPGEIFALVGMYRSGKSAVARAITGLLPPAAKVVRGSIHLDIGREQGVDLLRLPARKWRRLRRSRMAYLFGDVEGQMNPKLTVCDQIAAAVRMGRRRRDFRKKDSWKDMLYEVGLVDPDTILDCYPDQLEAVVIQRVMVAMALMKGATILVAEEPSLQLDATGESQILDLLRKIRDEHRMTVLLMTHHPALLEGVANRVAILFEGQIVDIGFPKQLFNGPSSSYCRQMLECMPRLDERRSRLGEIDVEGIRGALSESDEVSADSADPE